MPTLKELMQERMDSRPDKHTLAWWQDQFEQVAKGYRGLTHACNRVLADNEDQFKNIQTLVKAVTRIDLDLQEANAKIGQLQAELTELKETMDKAREAYAELNKKIKPLSDP